MADKKIMKDIGFNDEITITAHAHVWLTAMSGYAEAEWVSAAMGVLFRKVQEAILDPIWMSEQEAAVQQQQDMQQSIVQQFTTGEKPEVPPHMEDGLLWPAR